MNKLEQLQQIVKEMFDQAENKADVEALSRLQNATKEVEQEQNTLIAENKELLKDYKELVTHTSFNDKHNEPTDQVVSNNAMSFEDALAQFIAKGK